MCIAPWQALTLSGLELFFYILAHVLSSFPCQIEGFEPGISPFCHAITCLVDLGVHVHRMHRSPYGSRSSYSSHQSSIKSHPPS
ncbi:hypothetical protein F4823DRAFT_580122 [Ustulina deusta]|nr:hypothetical protein F4823DRAFT_580122 [Ustulina deusta]